MNNVSIGRIKPQEATIVEEMSLSHLTAEARAAYLAAAPEAVKQTRAILRGETGVCLVARIKDEVVGYVYGQALQEQRTTIRYAELENIYVLPEHRRLGIGAELGKAFLAWAQDAGFERISVQSGWRNREQLLPFYEALGFRPTTITMEVHLE